MTQILLYQCEDGIVLATDSRAVAFRQKEGRPERFEVRKLFQLSPQTIAITGGAGFGVQLCDMFQGYVKKAGLHEFDEISQSALGFFQNRIKNIRLVNGHIADRANLDRVYILIAGCSDSGAENRPDFLLLASESREDPLHVKPRSNVVAIPRQMTMEYKLANLQPSDDILGEVESMFEKFLSRLAESDDDIGPPFHFVRITPGGIQTKTRTS